NVVIRLPRPRTEKLTSATTDIQKRWSRSAAPFSSRHPGAQCAQPPSASRREFVHARANLCHHLARLHPLHLHLITTPNEVTAAQCADEEGRQNQISDKSVDRIERRDVPACGCSEQHFAAIPECAEAREAECQWQAEGLCQYPDDGHR